MNNIQRDIHSNRRTLSRVQGFTLLELLVVIVIITILFSFATLTIRSASPEDQIKEEAQRLHRLIELALEEAVLKNTEFGLEFASSSYRFLSYVDASWQPVTADRLLRERELPEDMELELMIEQINVIIGDSAANDDTQYGLSDDSSDEEELKPQVFLLSSTEITPEFTVRFSLPGIETSYLVSGYIDGRLETKQDDF